jgi:pyrroline-5-carboxylate reductase
MLHDQTFAFIGSGAMGEAMIKGLITQANLPPQQIVASDTRAERGLELEQKYGVRHTTDNRVAASGTKIVVLSVKPQVLHDVLKQLAGLHCTRCAGHRRRGALPT